MTRVLQCFFSCNGFSYERISLIYKWYIQGPKLASFSKMNILPSDSARAHRNGLIYTICNKTDLMELQSLSGKHDEDL